MKKFFVLILFMMVGFIPHTVFAESDYVIEVPSIIEEKVAVFHMKMLDYDILYYALHDNLTEVVDEDDENVSYYKNSSGKVIFTETMTRLSPDYSISTLHFSDDLVDDDCIFALDDASKSLLLSETGVSYDRLVLKNHDSSWNIVDEEIYTIDFSDKKNLHELNGFEYYLFVNELLEDETLFDPDVIMNGTEISQIQIKNLNNKILLTIQNNGIEDFSISNDITAADNMEIEVKDGSDLKNYFTLFGYPYKKIILQFRKEEPLENPLTSEVVAVEDTFQKKSSISFIFGIVCILIGLSFFTIVKVNKKRFS